MRDGICEMNRKNAIDNSSFCIRIFRSSYKSNQKPVDRIIIFFFVVFYQLILMFFSLINRYSIVDYFYH